jgi:hypothetical protein
MQTKFKNLKEFSNFIAFTVIDTNLLRDKKIPITFDWKISDMALASIGDKDIQKQIRQNKDNFNEMVTDRAYQIVENMIAEDFFIIEDEFLRLKTEEEIQNEIDLILSEDSSEDL